MAGSRSFRLAAPGVASGQAESPDRAAGPNRFEIEHVSHYRYSSPARFSVMSLCVRPRQSARQQLLAFSLATEPLAAYSQAADPYGNTKHVVCVHRRHEFLKIMARATVKVGPAVPLPPAAAPGAWNTIRAWRDSFALWDFTRDSPLARSSPALAAFIARERIRPADDPLQAVIMLCETLHRVFDYVPGSTSAASPIDHILESGRGVCQDYAHVMIAIARSWGVPSRYVSGYVHVTGRKGEQAPQTATHAWVECRLPGLGWIGFDPTNCALVGARHVTIAVGRDYQDVPPSKGVLHGFVGSILEVDVRMSLLPPRKV